MLILIVFEGLGVPFVIPNSNVSSTAFNEKKTVVRVGADVTNLLKHFKIPKKLWNKTNVFIDLTNDPTNDVAGRCVSLGYWVQRHKLSNAKLVSLNPLTFECEKKDYSVHFTRPMRPLFESKEELIMQKLELPIKRLVNENKKH